METKRIPLVEHLIFTFSELVEISRHVGGQPQSQRHRHLATLPSSQSGALGGTETQPRPLHNVMTAPMTTCRMKLFFIKYKYIDTLEQRKGPEFSVVKAGVALD